MSAAQIMEDAPMNVSIPLVRTLVSVGNMPH